jgi:hypothetical protein
MKAIVTKSAKHDSIIMISKTNPNSASIMLRSETLGANDQGFLQKEVRVGLFKGKTEDLKALNLHEGQDFSTVIPIKLIVKESFDPFYAGQEPKMNPDTKETVTSGGAPVYRQTIVVADSSAEVDAKLPSDRVVIPINTPAAKRATEFSK